MFDTAQRRHPRDLHQIDLLYGIQFHIAIVQAGDLRAHKYYKSKLFRYRKSVELWTELCLHNLPVLNSLDRILCPSIFAEKCNFLFGLGHRS